MTALSRMVAWLERRARLRHCPHSNLIGIYGDAINQCGGWRLSCLACGRYVDGPVALAEFRYHERELR